jgi:hypothetical protein
MPDQPALKTNAAKYRVDRELRPRMSMSFVTYNNYCNRLATMLDYFISSIVKVLTISHLIEISNIRSPLIQPDEAFRILGNKQ